MMTENPGYLIITRPLFLDSLVKFRKWKRTEGFKVFTVTAEEIETTYPGDGLRHKIRNCIRQLHKENGVQYVLMIGDSVNEPMLGQGEEPPPASLSEPWNLPAGYYRLDGISNLDGQKFTILQHSSLFYADLNNVEHYDKYAYL